MSNDVMNGVPAERVRSRSTYGKDGIEAALRQVTLLHQAFELRAAAEPDTVALVVGEERITCGELDTKANQLARFLIEQGVGPEVRVAICAERNAEMVIAMFAVLKAGGAYVPVDPAYPGERQAIILGDSGASLLLTQEPLSGRLPETTAKTILLDRDWPQVASRSGEPIEPVAETGNLAYLIYTSGSTGRPKAVAIEHRSTLSLLRWASTIYSPEELSGVLASTSICFDISIFELFVTLGLGGKAILADNALSLPALPVAGEVTLVNTVPSAIAELLRSRGIPPSVRTINLAGEALRGILVERLYDLETVEKIYNLYGPSEDTTFSTWALMKRGDSRLPAVGRPLEGTSAHLLSPELHRVPSGEPGELYLGGEGLSRGYLGRPDLTASRFVPDPFAVTPGERMYATGDLIRYRQDGELDYLGRIDHQVKIRGFRIELGEIESALERHPDVADTVVVARELEESGEIAEKVLVAYVVPRGAAVSIAGLRDHLRERLIAAMIPTHFVVMAALPLNPNGKVDRKALPKPEISGERPGFVAPRTPLEAALAEIWSEVLSLPGVGVEDHFFELGGHSLLAARAIARIHDTLGRRLPARALFDAPTIERLAVLLTGLPAGEDLAGIPVAQDRRWIISAGQEGMWFSERLNADLPIFTIPLLLDLEGPLDPGALQRSLAEIVRRHETLRVVFSESGGRPEPALAGAMVDLPRIDLTALPGDLRNRETERLAAVLAELHVSLERAPLLRGYLIARDERDHRLLIAMHHIAGDDWSTWVLAHDLAALYAADVERRPATLPPLPLQFSDYATWQQEWLAGAEAHDQLAYWQRRLAGSPELLDLPTDRPRPPLQSFAGGLLSTALPPQDAQALLRLALRSNATLFMAILALLDTLLHRYSGQENLSVGASTANRHRSGTQGLIGLFTNTVVLRADLHGEPSFGHLLAQVQETALEGLDRQDFPFDRLVRELRLERRLSHPILTQVFLSFQNIPPLPRQLASGLNLRVHELGNGTSKADLTLYLRQEGETFVTAWEYASALFDPPTIARLSGHFQGLLAAAVADPARPISELSLLTVAEEEQIWRWSEGAAAPPRELTLQEMFVAQAARTPTAPAVIAEGRVCSYAELDAQSSLLAGYLRELGVGPEVLVGLCLERSLEMVVALLAVLKAGGAYVPLDPEYPAERLAVISAEAKIQGVLTQGRFLHVLPEPRPEFVIALDGDWPSAVQGSRASGGEAQLGADGNSLAYVIFTSGSTGHPKGVAIPQRAVVNHMLWMQAAFPLHPGDRVFQKTPFGFDASVWEFYAPLLAGATLVMAKPGGQREPGYLAETIRQQGITILQAVPALLRAMLDDGRLEACRTLRRVFCGGEALSADIQRDFFVALDAELINLYGPTETTIEVSSWLCERERLNRTALLGRPITNARLQILNPRGELCPIGVPGEICVGGLPVGRGYFGRQQETAARFVPDRFGGERGGRLYHTGDLGRWLPDGTLEFLGRTDHQVKVRGFRVELGEIEAVTASHPAIVEAAVLATGQQLLGYVAIRLGTSVEAAGLRDFLRERLPEYMVPAVWMLLEALPHTPSGKVDRQALSGLRPTAAEELPAGEAPRNAVEERLAEIWTQLLGRRAIGVHDNFFDLGGHSLLATQFVSRVRDFFGVELPVQHLFEAPTIVGLAEIIDSAVDLAAVEIPRIEPAYRGKPLAASFAQESLWVLHVLDPASHLYNVRKAWRLNGRFSAAALEAGLEALVRRHEALRTHFVEIEGRPCQEISAPAPVSLPQIDLMDLPWSERGTELERIVSAAGQPFDLHRGPLLRVWLVVLSADEHILLLTAHLAVFDDESERILTRELSALYEAAADGREANLPRLPVQYADFAVWQRSWLRDGVVDRLLAWWRDELKDAPTALELPTDRPRLPAQAFRGAWEELEVPVRSATTILDVGRHEGATTFITLLALFQTLLHRLSGQDDLLVGTPVANRSLSELEMLIGHFANSVVLRSRFDGTETFLQQLARVRETALSVFSRQHLPFSRLAASLQAERDPPRSPIFQVLFSLDAPAVPLALRSVSAQPLPTGVPAAKFDLSLRAIETDGGLRLNLEYNLDLFDPATARRILESFEAVLTEISQDPGRRLDAISLLPAAALRELCSEASRTIGLRDEPHCLHDLFSVQAARRQEALAVLSAGGQRLTYGEADRLSSRLARFLIRQGIMPETPVGVCLERSPEMLIALLGILKAGGVYLPLDPAYPAERLAFMLEDSQTPLVLTQKHLVKEIPAGRWKTVSLDAQDGPLAAAEKVDADLASRAMPESLAYLIYTSGSTGRPKGVGIPHAAAAEHMGIAAGLFGFQDEDRMLSFSSPSFDASIEEIFAPLVRGATVVLRDADLWSSAELVHQVARLGVTTLGLPTAYWHHWVADCERIQPPSNLALRLVVLGGEAMLGEAARRWWRSPLAGISLVNAYGPTEGVITSTALVVDAEAASSASGMVPIGRALPGRSTWVLDRFGHPVPAGVAGELCLGGPLMARGYLGRPELTAERFVPDPFAGSPGGRLYRTGDLARRRPDGVLEFLGRVDRQLKIRGFRVEPGEIESALERHPAILEVAVDSRPDPGGSQRLVAWIVPAGAASLPIDLAGFLRGTLPDHMVPSAFVAIEALPLTPNGKVKLRALPPPEFLGGDQESTALPRTLAEERMTALWRELLGLSRVGIQESFFSLGGHSLLATRLLSRVRDTFGVEITFPALFSAPTIKAMAAILEGVLLREETVPASAAGDARGHRLERPPLSFSQQSLWLVERLQKAGGAYNLPAAIRFEGAVDVAALATAIGGVVRRHEALRTRFAETDGEPWQEVLSAPVKGPELPLADLSGLPKGRREEEALRVARAESGRALDLGAGPLLRAALVRLGPTEHLFLLVIHHAVSDGWSGEVLLRDLAAFYEAAATGRPAGLPRLPLQFVDYAIWQREHLRGEALAELLGVWHRRLAGVPPLDLPTDHRRPPVWTFRGDSRSVSLNVSMADLDRLARTQGATSFMVLLAALQVLLGRYTGQNDFAVGTPSANRTRSELEGLVGFFVNMLPLRADLSGAPAFGELLTRVRATALEAFEHQDIPFELLVEDLAPERDLRRNPLFQVALQLGYAGALSFSGLAARRVDLGGGTAKFDLNLSVEQSGSRFTLVCEYPVDLFEGTTIERLLGHFQNLLAAGLAEPGHAIGDLPLLTELERHQLLVGFNDTGSSSGPELCLHQLFEAQAEQTPERTALVAPEGTRLTYRELNQRADRLAHSLRALGLGPERLAGVLMDRTADLIMALLAVLKTGGAYAPLDPNYPQSRVLLMLETSQAAVLVTRRRLAAALEGELPNGLRTVFLEPGWDKESIEEPVESRPALPDNLAYVIFTSGSTGVPKGVAIQHRSAVAMVRWAHTMYTPAEYAGVLASTSICFDMSVFEIFATLAAGGKILLAENALALPDLAARDEVVLVDTVPSAMSELLRLGRLPSTIRTVNLGGEALKGSLVQEIHRQLPGVERVVNLYGPSEDTTFTSYAVVPPDAEHPLIGRPLAGEAAYVLDARMRPVPIGIPGALYMGGEGVTRGYLHRPDLTAERFIPNPYGPPGSRLYQVGDLVRYLPTGELDFLGRLDTQVKVRGFRVELGEIESALTRHPEIWEAAVLAVPDATGGTRLIAYVESARDFIAGELRSHLKQSLPEYMVPSVFVPLRELPLTPNGKIDRRALAAMPLLAESAAAGVRAPQGYAETLLVGIWSKIFGHPVGVNDHFFDLGGHSLLATRVTSRVREALGIDLPLSLLFEQPTLAGLAASLEAALEIETSPAAVHPYLASGIRPLSFAQRRLWFLDQLLPNSAVYNIPYPLSLEGELDPRVLARALSEVVRRHEVLRTTFPSHDGEPYQEITSAGPVPLPAIDLSGLPETSRGVEAAALTRMDMIRPFDLGNGPILRTALLRLGEESHRLLLTMHHIVSDGWSLEILLRELVTLYEAFAAGRPSPLPELLMQYADFAVWQQRWLSGARFSRQLDFWRAQLEGAPAGLDLPTDFPRPAMQTFNGAVRSAELPLGLSADIRALCRREGVTLFMLLLAGFDVLLARYSGQEDILIGSPIANRNRLETEDLIGFFVNMLVFRVKLSSASSFRSLLRQVRETAPEAYDHQDLPFEALVEELRPERDLSRTPFFQILLLVQTLQRELPGMDHLKLSPVDEEDGSAKFDLSLVILERENALWTSIEYNTDLFEGATASRLLGHLGQLLAAAVSDPERGWRDLPLLTEAEREQLLVGFNDTGSTRGPELCLHQLFEAQVERTPERTALVVPEGTRWTYRELNQRAERLARRLRALGLGPERLAGVLMDRTADLIVTLLAVLKAGGAYAPLDPNYPQSRVLLMLETSRAAVLVTRHGLAAAFEGELPAGMRTVFSSRAGTRNRSRSRWNLGRRCRTIWRT